MNQSRHRLWEQAPSYLPLPAFRMTIHMQSYGGQRVQVLSRYKENFYRISLNEPSHGKTNNVVSEQV